MAALLTTAWAFCALLLPAQEPAPVPESPPAPEPREETEPTRDALRDGAPLRHAASGEELREILHSPRARRLGRQAKEPSEIPWPGWKAVLGRTFNEMISDRMSLAASGCAFYAVLALFPALSMLVFLYGLAFNPAEVEPQIVALHTVLPPPAVQLISERVHELVSQKAQTLGIGLIISTLVAFWSAAAGTKSVIYALNVAYEERETRSFLRFQVVSLAMTIVAILSGIFGIAFLVALPTGLSVLHLPGNQQFIAQGVGLVVLLGFVLLSLAVLYRYGPARRRAKWHWITPGSLLATVLWVVASELFSVYVTYISSFSVTYGSLGAFVGVMMWFYVTAYVVLLGAELNSELELQTAHDSTSGPPKPLGKRGAYVADHVAGE